MPGGVFETLRKWLTGELNTIKGLLQSEFTAERNEVATVDVDNAVRFQVALIDNDSGPIVSGDITPGTITISRIRAGVTSVIVAATPFSKADGMIYYDYTFAAASWATDDSFLVEADNVSFLISGSPRYPAIPPWYGAIQNLSSLESKVDTLILDQNVPAVDAVTNLLMRDGVGNKDDTIDGTSLFSLSKKNLADSLSKYGVVTNYIDPTSFASTNLIGLGDGMFAGTQGFFFVLVLRDAAGLGAAPQGEFRAISGYSSATGTFTHSAFSTPLANGDEIAIVQSSVIMGEGAIGYGTFTTDSDTAPADTGQGAKAQHYFRGCILMPLSGVCAFQPRLIRSFTTTTGVFTLDPATPFTAAPGLVDYVILPNVEVYIPSANETDNVLPPHVIGNKADDAVETVGTIASILAYCKGILNRLFRKECQTIVWSDVQPLLIIPAIAADLDFPTIHIPTGTIPSGATLLSVRLLVKWRKQVDSSGAANAIDGASKTIRAMKSTGAWGTDDLVGIDMPNDILATEGSATEGGDIIIGDHDIKAEIDENNVDYYVRSEETNGGDAIVVDAASLTLVDVQTGFIIRWT